MSRMKNYMMDIQEFCDDHAFGGDECDIDEVVNKANLHFKSRMAANYAENYLTTKYGET